MESKSNNNAIIINPQELDKKIEAMKKDGVSSLHIVSDFDRTLTKAFYHNKKAPSILSELRNGKYLTKEYAEKAHDLYNQYHPIEVSKELEQKEKNEKMREWWKSHYELLANSGLDKTTISQAIKDMIAEKTIELRKDCNNFLNKLNENNIPLVIMSSGGIGNMVIEFLKEQKFMHENIHFIGNTLEFNKDGKFTRIKDNKIIHVFNKHEIELKNLPIYNEIKNRKNIILLGDSLGDLGMLEGSNYKNLIKIAFFNYPDEENLEDFKKNFDIIILNDGSFDYINQLLKEILE